MDFVDSVLTSNITAPAVRQLYHRAGIREVQRSTDVDSAIVHDCILAWTSRLVRASAGCAALAKRQHVQPDDVVIAAELLGKDIAATVEQVTATNKGNGGRSKDNDKEAKETTHKARRGTVAKRQIAKQQDARRPAITFEGYKRELKKIAYSLGLFPTFTFPRDTIAIIQLTVEYLAVLLLRSANLIARTSGRVGVNTDDLDLASVIAPNLIPRGETAEE